MRVIHKAQFSLVKYSRTDSKCKFKHEVNYTCNYFGKVNGNIRIPSIPTDILHSLVA